MTELNASCRARLLFDTDELHYDFGPGHPLQPSRLVALMDLLEATGLWHSASEQDWLPVRPATLEELGLVHTAQCRV